MKKILSLLSFCSVLMLTSQILIAQTKSNSDKTYENVDQNAVAPGGLIAFQKYLGSNIKYPKEAQKSGTEGKVLVQFIVNKTGLLSDFKILKGIDKSCDQEAMRVLQAYKEKWTPAHHEGKVVNQRMVIPIQFALGKKSDS